MNKGTICLLQTMANLGVSGDVWFTPEEARYVLDMEEDLRYAGEAVDRAYRQAGVDPRQQSLVSRYADVDR